MKSVHIRRCGIARIMFETCLFRPIMIKTTSRDSFDHDQTKHVKNGGQCGGRRVPKRSTVWPTVRTNALLKYGTMERYSSNNQRLGCVESRIFENIAAKRKRVALQCKTRIYNREQRYTNESKNNNKKKNTSRQGRNTFLLLMN